LEGLLKAGVDAVRLGRPEIQSSGGGGGGDAQRAALLLGHSVEEMATRALGRSGVPSLQRRQHIMGLVRAAEVICCTCIGAGSAMLRAALRHHGGGGGGVDAVLMDEAAQSTEVAATVALTCGCHRLVLVGDHYQLSPTVLSDAARAEGMTVSLFERLVRAGVTPCVLGVQYRMHPAISSFASDAFYGGKVSDGVSAADRPAPAGLHWPNPLFGPVMFVPSPSNAESGSDVWGSGDTSKYNDAEVAIVRGIVQQLLSPAGRVPAGEIGVITPYSGQVWRLRQALGGLRGMNDASRHHQGSPGRVECHSVDGFQGREKTVIVVSAVRSNERGHVGFLADWCRTNVSITRARCGLVIVGNERTLRHDRRSWEPFWDWARAHGVGRAFSPCTRVHFD
jgi:superfamily I DNA and/or RNA helicase